MKKLNIILLIVTLLFVTSVSASHSLTYPNYFDVNVSERITITNGDEIPEQSAFIFLDGILSEFSKTSDNSTFELFITGTEETDKPFIAQVYNSTVVITQINTSDNLRNTQIIITDSVHYAYRRLHLGNHTGGDIEDWAVCPLIKNHNGNPVLRSYVAIDNGTNITFIHGTSTTITNNQYEVICLRTDIVYPYDINGSFNQFLGIECTNCDSNNGINFGLDTTNITNESVTFENITSQPVNITTSNHMFIIFRVNGTPITDFRGIFKFRIPYYVSVNLFSDKNTTLQTNFDYIYLKNTSGLSLTTDLSSTQFTEFGAETSRILTLGLFDRTTADLSEVFWGQVNSNTAIIKLYEQGNYTITLLTMKAFLPSGWIYEFIKPQYTRSKIETKLINKLEFTEKINQSANIWLSEYEAHKSGFYFNIVKWLFVVFILLVGIGLSFISGEPIKGLGATMILITALVKLLGLI